MMIYAVPAAKHMTHKLHAENPQGMFPIEKKLARDTYGHPVEAGLSVTAFEF